MMNKTVSRKLDWAPRPPYINFIYSSDGKQVTWTFVIIWRPSSVNFDIWNFSSKTAWANEPLSKLLISTRYAYKYGCHRQFVFLVSRFLKYFSSETAESNLASTHLWKILYADYSFRPDPLANMIAIGYSCFWLDDF